MLPIPRAEVQPAGIFNDHVFLGRNGVIFGHSYHFLSVCQFIQIIEDRRNGAQVRCAGAQAVIPVDVAVVFVICHDIYIIIARIPCVRVCVVVAVVFPDDIVETIFFGQCGVQKFPQFLVYFCTAVAPPEPGSAVAVVTFVALRFMQRTENNRNICILELLQLLRQILHSFLEVLVFLCAFLDCVCSIKGAVRLLIVLIGAFLPVYDITQCIVVKVNRNIDVPGRSYNTIAILCPCNGTLRCAVIPAVQRVVVHKVEAADCRQLSGFIFDIIKFQFRIVIIAAAVDFLLAGNDMRTVYALEVGHQRTGFLRCLRIYRGICCVGVFRLRCLCQCHVVIQTIAPAAAESDGIFTLCQLQIAPVKVVPVVCVRNLHSFFRFAFIGTCDSNLRFTNIVQIHNAACHQAIHTGFRGIYSKAHGTGTGNPYKTVTGVSRIGGSVYIGCNLCIVFQR